MKRRTADVHYVGLVAEGSRCLASEADLERDINFCKRQFSSKNYCRFIIPDKDQMTRFCHITPLNSRTIPKTVNGVQSQIHPDSVALKIDESKVAMESDGTKYVDQALIMLEKITSKFGDSTHQQDWKNFGTTPFHEDRSLTPSKKANYVHTLLSGRVSPDEPEYGEVPRELPDGNCDIENSKSVDSSLTQEYKTSALNDRINQPKDTKSETSPNRTDVEQKFHILSQESRMPQSSFESATEYNEDKTLTIGEIISKYYTVSCEGNVKSQHNLNENIRVVVRCRPVDTTNNNSIIKVDGNRVTINKPGNAKSVLESQRPKAFQYIFDSVFGDEASQEDVFLGTAENLIPKVFEGVNGTVFAYGSTGAGKTFTMMGNEHKNGIVQLSINNLFEIKSSNWKDALVYFSYFEVYNESVLDLLNPGKRNLEIKEDANEVKVHNLTSVKVDNRESVYNLLNKGNKLRKTEMTVANHHSSRSHAVLQFLVNCGTKKAKLCFIDLAGSERASATENRGDRLKEASYINQSLLALANCINSLSESSPNKARVKYRDSKLTHLLKSSLFGNSLVVMIAVVHPGIQYYQESSNTLKYAHRAKEIKIVRESTFENFNDNGKGIEMSLALKECYVALGIIGRYLPDQVYQTVAEVLKNSDLVGTGAILNIINSK